MEEKAMNEQGQMTGTEGTVVKDVMATPEKALAAKAPEILAPEPRECYKCPAVSGNGQGIFDEGRPIFDEKLRRVIPGWLCPTCRGKETAEFRRHNPILAAEALIVLVREMNEKREAERAAAKAAREADGRKYEAVMTSWHALAAGKIKGRFAVRMDEKGNLLCGDERCSYCAGRDRAIQFALVEGEVVGLCVHQVAARRDCKVPWVQIPWGSRETCEREVARRREAKATFVRAVGLFMDLWDGKAERPTLVLDEKGKLLCGVPGCGCREPAEDGLLSEKMLTRVGLCRFHRAACHAACHQGAEFFVASIEECDRRLERIRERAMRAAYQRLERAPWASPDHVRPVSPKERSGQRPARPEKPTPPPAPVEVSEGDLAQAVCRGRVSIQEAAAAGDPAAIEVLRLNAKADATCRAKSKKGGGKNSDKGKPGKGGRK